MDEHLPATRWETHRAEHDGYQRRFAELIDRGEDIDGEARVADALVGRGARVLDAGSGIGRVSGALAARGHRVVGVEKDPVLVADSRRRFPGVPVLETDLLGLSADLLTKHGLPTAYDLVVVVGNVLILLAEDTEQRVLAVLRDLLDDGGRMLVGFHTAGGPAGARTYSFEELATDAAAVGLAVQHRFGTYQLHPPADDYVVAVLGMTNVTA